MSEKRKKRKANKRDRDLPVEPAVQRVAPAAVREAGFECATMAAAEQRLGVEDLAAVLDRSKRLKQAWDKGRRLRDIRDLAATPICMEMASQKLGLGQDGLLRLYRRDLEIRDLWDRGRIAMAVETKRNLMARAAAGSERALAQVERILSGELGYPSGSEPAVDFARLSPTQIAEATGIKRQQILRWHKLNGLPRNSDGTYSLPAFLEWHWRFELDKRTHSKGTPGVDPLREQKARIARVQADQAEDRVWDRATVIGMLTARAARLVQLFNAAKAREWSQAHEGKTAAQLEPEYLAAFKAARWIWKEFPEEIPLPPAAKAKIEEALELLMKDDR